MLDTNVKNTADLMSIALHAEREAIRRYTELAEKMHAGGNASAAGLFERLVEEECEHERMITEWMTQEQVQENPDLGPIRWRDPNVPTVYNEEARDPYYSSPYRAMAFAVHNEEIAFRFYTHVAAHSENREVRRYAEILAREELGHAALLRAERRRAYHAERNDGSIEPRIEPTHVHSEEDLLAATVQMERHLVEQMDRLADAFPDLGPLSRQTREQIEANEQRLRGYPPPGEAITRDINRYARYHADHDQEIDSEAAIRRLCSSSDRSFVFFDGVVASTDDEAVMLDAQIRATAALDRIGILKDLFGDRYATVDTDHPEMGS